MRRVLMAGALALACAFCATDTPAVPVGGSASLVDGVVVDMAAVSTAIEARLQTVRGHVGAHLAADVDELYDDAGHAPLWLDNGGSPSRGAHDALTLLRGAEAEGLNPGDYLVSALEAQAAALGSGDRASAAQAAAFDVGLSVDVLRFLRHVHVGRVDPRDIGYRLTVPADDHGFAMLVATAVAGDRVGGMLAEVRPAIPLYEPLIEKLAEYRARAAAGPHATLPEIDGAVRPGDVYKGVAALTRHLVTAGDVPEGTSFGLDATTYDGPLVEALTRFQGRHGLATDGVLGQHTYAALSVPLSWRVRQIELALERLRWLPHLAQGRVIIVNIPMFHLWSWDRLASGGAPASHMGVIVGRAVATETPVFAEDMTYLEFRPYWNVPASIVRGEILPRIAREPDYLRRQNMEIVRGWDAGAPRVEVTEQSLALLRQGTLRLRQRPGPTNALGLVKFMFPNDHSVYLHSTPVPALFDRARRDFSHGCVRVADPVGLAVWAMNDPAWTPERIRAAMERGADARAVRLADPVQVILTYVTAMVWPEDGSMRFAADIYGHDALLNRALAGHE